MDFVHYQPPSMGSKPGRPSQSGKKQAAMLSPEVKLPGFGLALDDMPNWTNEKDGVKDRFPHAIVDFFAIEGITLREQQMLLFVNQITDKPRWFEKIYDDEIVAEWREDACGSSGDWVHKASSLSPKSFEYCLAQLKDKATYFNEHGLIHVLECRATIVKTDLEEGDSFCAQLSEAVEPLENVPANRKDWHPFSDNTVLDLVHPSLHPLKYGSSRALLSGKVDLETCAQYTGRGEIVPYPDILLNDEGEYERDQSWGNTIKLKPWGSYQWLPADIKFNADGKAQIDSYVNNLHPHRHRNLYSLLELAVEKAVPLWEECLSFWHNRLPMTELGCGYEDYDLNEAFVQEKARIEARKRARKAAAKVEREQNQKSARTSHTGSNSHAQQSFDDGDQKMADNEDGAYDGDEQDDTIDTLSETGSEADLRYDMEDRWRDWLMNNPDLRKIRQPEPNAAYIPFQERIEKAEEIRVNLRGEKHPQGLQVIFKLANIHLTPEKPTYDGSNWHVEGALNEHICATALFYYDQDNIETAALSFRHQVDAEAMVMKPQQNESEACEDLYGVAQEQVAVQKIGSVLTRPGRILAFPNVMQHSVLPFSLEDKTRPGYRKILAMFLVDPHIRILSTANVPPQRVDWWAEEIYKIDTFAKLPVEVFDRIISEVKDFPLSWAEALTIREELMEERGAQTNALEEAINEDTFSFCEH